MVLALAHIYELSPCNTLRPHGQHEISRLNHLLRDASLDRTAKKIEDQYPLDLLEYLQPLLLDLVRSAFWACLFLDLLLVHTITHVCQPICRRLRRVAA